MSDRRATPLKRAAKQVFRRLGYDISARLSADETLNQNPDFPGEFRQLYAVCAPYTVCSVERVFAVYQAACHLVDADVPGDVVECGVYRGGTSLMAALTLQRRADDRKLWLYDTFTGMTAPGELDVDYMGTSAAALWERGNVGAEYVVEAPIESVRSTFANAGIPADRLRFVVGPVEDTLPGEAPEGIAMLRLDTDWYESTAHELEHLYPRLGHGGVLIIDDYGHWAGARRAVDEYFADRRPLLFARTDYSGRMAVKP